jgi:hypothetical protein
LSGSIPEREASRAQESLIAHDRFGSWSFSDLHYWASLALGITLIPALLWSGLPVRFDWPTYFSRFWLSLALQSIFAAALLYVIGFPLSKTLLPLWQRFQAQKGRLLILVLLLVYFFTLFPPAPAFILAVDSIAVAELIDRMPRKRGAVSSAIIDVILPATYLFLGFVAVFSYNYIVVSHRFYGAYDSTFNRMDSWILAGHTVLQIAHHVAEHVSSRWFQFLEFIYFGMFAQIGAAIIITALSCGRRQALKLVGTILLTYYFALALFALWPSQGPYFTCPNHFQLAVKEVSAFSIQKSLLANAAILWEHWPIRHISVDFFIAFPCMHIAQPMIVLWYLRRWPRITRLLLAYDVLLIAAILLLEWHYFVDLIGGAAVAAAALWITDRDRRRIVQPLPG